MINAQRKSNDDHDDMNGDDDGHNKITMMMIMVKNKT